MIYSDEELFKVLQDTKSHIRANSLILPDHTYHRSEQTERIFKEYAGQTDDISDSVVELTEVRKYYLTIFPIYDDIL